MCGRYTQTRTLEGLVEAYDLEVTAEARGVQPSYNIAPSQGAAVIPQASRRVLTFMQWGLVPHWARDPSIGLKMINARAETLRSKPAFRGLLRSKRCLVPASGFFEWTRGTSGGRQPVYFFPGDGVPWAFAGLWDCRHDEEGGAWMTFTIITCEANARVRPVHARMPVILDPEAAAVWVDPAEGESSSTLDLLHPFPEARMDVHPVSPRMNRPDWNSPSCIEPAYPEPDLFGFRPPGGV